MNKELFHKYTEWKDSYGLTSEPEYETTQEYDFMQCFEAGYNEAKKEKSPKVDCSTTLIEKLQTILISHFGLREFEICTYSKTSYKLIAEFEVETHFNVGRLNLSEEFSIKMMSINPYSCRFQVECYTTNYIDSLIKLIAALTKETNA